MAIVKGNIVIIGSEEEDAPRRCVYCGEMGECRPYGYNWSMICYNCAMKPENKPMVDENFRRLIKGASFNPQHN
jgi:hypothetical protein